MLCMEGKPNSRCALRNVNSQVSRLPHKRRAKRRLSFLCRKAEPFDKGIPRAGRVAHVITCTQRTGGSPPSGITASNFQPQMQPGGLQTAIRSGIPYNEMWVIENAITNPAGYLAIQKCRFRLWLRPFRTPNRRPASPPPARCPLRSDPRRSLADCRQGRERTRA